MAPLYCGSCYMSTTAVSNTSPLVAFSAIGRLDLLRNVFEPLLIPAGVRDELFPSGTIWTEAEAVQRGISQASWLQVVVASQGPSCPALSQRLGAGEAEAIALAIQRNLPLVIDDLEARETARTFGLEIIGSLGVVARNKRMRAIKEAKPIVQAMKQAGIFYSGALIHQFLRELGEAP